MEYDYHIPVMVSEVVHYLVTRPQGVYVDGTLGAGGHTEAVLGALTPQGKVIGIDRDEEAVAFCRKRLAGWGDRVILAQGELEDLDVILSGIGISSIDGMLLDLGVSSHQIDTATRGFSYLEPGPLDMRMDTKQSLTAETVINRYSREALADLFYYYGEERNARRIARKIVETREETPITTTGQLADIIRGIVPSRYHIKTLARVWQSIRFEVNQELQQLRAVLEKGYALIRPSGRILVISYESLMDRMVKRFFRGEEPSHIKGEAVSKVPRFSFHLLTRRVVRPRLEEVQVNPRARSALLRAAEKRVGPALQ
jgi:16S rRNA (cytosine1402-N4)-methyltransferase